MKKKIFILTLVMVTSIFLTMVNVWGMDHDNPEGYAAPTVQTTIISN